MNITDPYAALDFDSALALASEHASSEVLSAVASNSAAGPVALLFALLETRL